MQLRPVTQPSLPSYPVRTGKETSFTRWVRRALAAACATGAIWAAGCYGSTGVGDEEPLPEEPTIMEVVSVVLEQPLLPEEPEPIAGGDMAPGFNCGSVSEWAVRTGPGWYDGSLCGDQEALAAWVAPAAGRYRFTLTSGGEFVFLSVRDAAGTELLELTPESTAAEADLAAGSYTLAATPADPMDNPYAWFNVTVETVD